MTALDQNFSSLASLLMQRRQMQQEQAQQDRANRLADLQYNRLNREEQYQTGLESAMANPGVNTATSIAPNPQPSLANLMPGSQLQPPQFEQQGPQVGPLASRVQTTTTPRSAAQAGAEYALSKGRVDDAIKMFSVDDAVAQLQAKGDLQGYYKAKQELDQGAKFFEVLKPYKGNPAALKQVWPQIQRMFPRQSEGITPDNIGADANGMFAPMVVNGKEVPNRVVYHDDDGKTHIVDTTPKDSGKPFDRQYDEGDTRVTELYDAQGKLTATKRAPRYKPAAPGGQEPVAQTTFVDAETGKPLVFDKKTGSYRVANVEGGVAPKPVAMSPEQATRAQQFETIVTNIPKIRDMVLDKNGNIISKLDIANSQVGTWGTKGREIRQAVKRTVEQALRIATGAAAPDSEVKNYTDMYAPQVGDTKEMIAEKFKALETFAEGTRAKFNVGRSPQAINQGKGASGKGGKQLDQNTAQKYLRQAGGNKEKARELARKAGYTF